MRFIAQWNLSSSRACTNLESAFTSSIRVRDYRRMIPHRLTVRMGAVAGGFFTGRYNSIDDIPEEGSRFDAKRNQGQVCRLFNGNWNKLTLVAQELSQQVCAGCPLYFGP